MSEAPRYLPVPLAADLLGVAPNTVRNRINAGRYEGRRVLDGGREIIQVAAESIAPELPEGELSIERAMSLNGSGISPSITGLADELIGRLNEAHQRQQERYEGRLSGLHEQLGEERGRREAERERREAAEREMNELRKEIERLNEESRNRRGFWERLFG